MPSERRWSNADRELVARAVHDHACTGDDCKEWELRRQEAQRDLDLKEMGEG